jgi:hypothetical protein
MSFLFWISIFHFLTFDILCPPLINGYPYLIFFTFTFAFYKSNLDFLSVHFRIIFASRWFTDVTNYVLMFTVNFNISFFFPAGAMPVIKTLTQSSKHEHNNTQKSSVNAKMDNTRNLDICHLKRM